MLNLLFKHTNSLWVSYGVHWCFINDEKKVRVYAAVRQLVGKKGFECSLREISVCSGVSYSHLHRSWNSQDALIQDTTKDLFDQITPRIDSSGNAFVILFQLFNALEDVPHSRDYLSRYLKSDDERGKNPIAEILLGVFEKAGVSDHRFVAAGTYLSLLSANPKIMSHLRSQFGLPESTDSLTLKFLEQIIKTTTK